MSRTAEPPRQKKTHDGEPFEGTFERITLTAENDEPLVVGRWTPSESLTPTRAVLIAPAMATPSRFYRHFSEWLASQGYLTYIFDYQGYGESATGPLTDVGADLFTWGADARTVARWVREDAAGLPLEWMAHSLGGQLMPFAHDERGRMIPDRAVLIGVGTGYWGRAEGRDRVLAPLLWYVIAPFTTRVYGYYPGLKLGILGDLPAPVMRQWTTWCRNPEYMWGVVPEMIDKFASVDIPITTVSFTDDETMSPAATAHLESYYTGADLRSLHYSPEQLGQERIGHMGFFRPRNQEAWAKVLIPLIEGAS